jgi:signal transduction histidine kinase
MVNGNNWVTIVPPSPKGLVHALHSAPVNLDDFPDGVIVAGPDGAVEYVNQRVRVMARAVDDEMIGMHLSRAVPFDDLNGNSWYDCVRPYDGLAIRTRISEQSWWSPKGSEYLITATLDRVRPAGPVQRVVVSLRNARIRNQRDRERSDLVATVAHELRSPLTGIKGFTSTLLTKWDKFSEEQRQFMLETVDADADRLTRLITELLDAARIDAGRLTLRRGPVKLDEVVRHVLTNISGATAVQHELTVGPGLLLVWGDADRLTQVVTNLAENAMRHGHGLRDMVVENGPGPSGDLGVSLRVRDNGPGIPEEMRQRVFSRFWRTGPGAGSGLGLYIVRGIIEEHGGRIEISDAEGGGASIRVWLPVNEPDSMTD